MAINGGVVQVVALAELEPYVNSSILLAKIKLVSMKVTGVHTALVDGVHSNEFMMSL
jgi:hypothetical protein